MEKKRIRLEDLPKKEIFRTPDRYFDELPSIIQAKVVKPTPEPAFTFSWTPRRTWLSLASASLIALLVWLTYPTRQESLGEDTLSQVNDQEIINYLKAQNINHLDIAEQFSIKEKVGVKTETTDTLLLQHLDVSDEEILQQLDPEDVQDVI